MEKLAQQNYYLADSKSSALASAAQKELDFIHRVLLGPQRGNLTAIECLLAQNFSQNSPMMPTYGTEWQNSKVPKLEMEKHSNGVDEAKLGNEGEQKKEGWDDRKGIRVNANREFSHRRHDICVFFEARLHQRRIMRCLHQMTFLISNCVDEADESCKQFFRRIILKKTLINCYGTKNCQIEKDGTRCRGCRLDKCLLAGMDPTMIYLKQKEGMAQYLERLELRKMSALLRKNCREGKNLFL
ncbi:hypothetical protein niasHT_030954 [Heterodera trifolii]|uniref:Nuclear receptor domain-containing protein n=1 Tax=Heterodera trifolii TaxID=157864 RepID=A0ABD2J8E2_9BILA